VYKGGVKGKELSRCTEACSMTSEEVVARIRENLLMRLAISGNEPLLVMTSAGAYAGVKSPGEWA